MAVAIFLIAVLVERPLAASRFKIVLAAACCAPETTTFLACAIAVIPRFGLFLQWYGRTGCLS